MPFALSPRRAAAALAVLAVAGAAASQAATAAPAPRTATGTAASQITLLDLSVAGHPISVGRLVLNSGNGTGTAAVTGLIIDGTSYGEKSLSTGSASSPSVSTSGHLPTNLVTVTSPVASLSAGNGLAHAGTDSLGAISVLGLPLALDGSASTNTGVDAVHAGADKTLVVRNLALPGIGGLLTALGLDITKLPASVLSQLVEKLGLVTSTITDAQATLAAALAPLQTQIAAAQQQVADAQQAVTDANATLASATTTLDSATTTLDSATKDLQAALATAPQLVRAAALAVSTLDPSALLSPSPLPSLSPSPLPLASPTLDPTGVLATPLPTATPTLDPTTTLTSPLPTALPSILPSALPVPSLPATISADLQPLVDTYNAAKAAYDTALADVNAATGAVDLANSLLATATSALNTILSAVAAETSALVSAITSVLNSTPLVSIDSFTVRTEASVTSADKGGQTARIVGGELQGVHVLGTDVLQQAIGSDRVDLGQVGGTVSELLNTAIGTVTGTLSSVLSTVPGLTIPTPTVELLSSTTATDIAGGFGTASNAVHALRVTIPALTIPTALQTAAPLGTLSVQALGSLVTSPVSIAVGTMTDTASFRPAVASNTGVVPPTQTVGSPTGTTPTASGPTASTPNGSVPNGSVPTGSTPSGSVPTSAGPGQPQLPRTGLGQGAGLLALGLCGAGLFLYRRNALV